MTVRRLYNHKDWHRLRAFQLREKPFCAFCLKTGKRTPAVVVDHIRRHGGDPVKFFDPLNLQSLCKPCHDRTKQRIEKHGFSNEIDADGWPIDPNHPANREGHG